MFATEYRVARDKIFSHKWAVQYRVWYWPCWTEWGNGLLDSRQDAEELIECLRRPIPAAPSQVEG